MTADTALEAAVDRIAQLLEVRIGLRSDTTMRGRLVRAVREEATHRTQGAAVYAARLPEDEGALQCLLNRVTVQETAFFRHPDQFEVLIRDVIPGLRPPVRIWSAGCANGQEAFSLAMVLEEQGIPGSVIATDISTAALDRTREARYTLRELSGVSPERCARHFTRRGDRWQVDAPLRDRVKTLHHNLLDPVPPEVGSCDVVLCRNVLIYLSPGQVHLFLDRVADSLPPGAAFLVGAAETIWQVSERFTVTRVGETFVYRRRDPIPPSPGQPPLSDDPPAARVGAVRARASAVTARTSRAHRSAATGSGSGTGADPRDGEATGVLEKVAQDAVAAGDYDAAVVAFRKCAYLTPHDPMAQLHLGLALEASGDEGSAQRAFAVARRVLVEAGPDARPAGLKGYAPSELLRLLESKQ